MKLVTLSLSSSEDWSQDSKGIGVYFYDIINLHKHVCVFL